MDCLHRNAFARAAGGHATLVWLRKDRLVRAVTDAFDRLEAAAIA